MVKAQAVLHLNLHREYFAQIAGGTKRTEYRECKPHWQRRLEGRKYEVIQFRNGYAANAPVMTVEFLGVRRRDREAGVIMQFALGGC